MAAPQRKPGDAQKFRKEWLANLALSASNNQLNQNASNMLRQTGASSLVRDMTTPTDRTAKAEGDKSLVRDFLSGNQFMNSYTAGETANNLLRPDELRFVLEYQDFISRDFKPRQVPAEVFVNYLRQLRKKVKLTQGVEYGIQEQSAYNLLGGLSVQNLVQLEFYKQQLETSPMEPAKKEKIRRLMEQWERLLLSPEDERKVAALGPEDAAEVYSLDTIIDEAFPEEATVVSALSEGDVDTLEGVFIPDAEIKNAGKQRDDILGRGAEIPPEEDPGLGLQPATSEFEKGLDFASAEERSTPVQAQPRTIPPTRGVPSLFSRDEDPYAEIEDAPIVLKTPREFNNVRPRRAKVDYILNEVNLDLFNTANNTNIGETGDAFAELNKLNDADLDNWYSIGYGAYKASGGQGLKGAGLVKKKKKSAVERSTGYVKPQPYTQLGSYLINKNKLKDGVLMVKYPSGQRISKLPTQAITKELVAVINVLMEGKQPTIRQFQVLNEAEKDKLHQIVRTTGLGVDVPNPKEEEMDKELNRFEILKGEFIAGNDNTKLIKEFKMMLIKFGREGRIPRREVNSILEEMLHMGH